ncbi:hypothetical protein NIES4074_05450 [Cylindrospermum sp. NIES-4074]|nr:hypothetical protein NIES4074_05450 [Cylindrospermum sp. NIES-4074]
MTYERIKRPSSWRPESQADTEPSRFAPRPFHIQAKQESDNPPWKQNIQDTKDAAELEIKEQSGNITPEEKENLGILRAKLDNYSAQQKQQDGMIRCTSFLIPTRHTPRVQMKLNLGKQRDKDEQEADKAAADVVQQSTQGEAIQQREMQENEKELKTTPKRKPEIEATDEAMRERVVR